MGVREDGNQGHWTLYLCRPFADAPAEVELGLHAEVLREELKAHLYRTKMRVRPGRDSVFSGDRST
jgi:hypothetical protein